MKSSQQLDNKLWSKPWLWGKGLPLDVDTRWGRKEEAWIWWVYRHDRSVHHTIMGNVFVLLVNPHFIHSHLPLYLVWACAVLYASAFNSYLAWALALPPSIRIHVHRFVAIPLLTETPPVSLWREGEYHCNHCCALEGQWTLLWPWLEGVYPQMYCQRISNYPITLSYSDDEGVAADEGQAARHLGHLSIICLIVNCFAVEIPRYFHCHSY